MSNYPDGIKLLVKYTTIDDKGMRYFRTDVTHQIPYAPEDALAIIEACLYFDVPVSSAFSSAMLNSMVSKLKALEEAVSQLQKRTGSVIPHCPEHGYALFKPPGAIDLYTCTNHGDPHSYTSNALGIPYNS